MGTENPNPYASPQAVDEVVPVAFPDGEGYYRDGKLLVVRNGAELPDRCVYCNEPSAPFRKMCNTLWFSILFGVARRIKVSYGVCSKHRFRQRMKWLAFLLFILGTVLAMILLGAMTQYAGASRFYFLLGIIAPYGCFVALGVSLMAVATWAGYPLKVRKADHSKVWLRGAREPFLASLNEAEE